MFKYRWLGCILCMFSLAYSESVWIQTTQEDFSNGTYECNLYASTHNGGSLEFTSRWDLNGDGYKDIVVSNEMGSSSYVYWGSAQGYTPNYYTSYPGNAHLSIVWDKKDNTGRVVPAGVYIYKINGDNISATEKVVALD